MQPDDNSLNPEQKLLVEKHAEDLLHRADASGIVPVPVDDLISAAKLTVAPYSVFDPRSLAAYAMQAGKQATKTVKQAIGKILGVLDASEHVIHIDDTVHETRQKFLKFHEAGHFELPHQKKLFRFFEDSEDELAPSVSDLFEREANNFARYVLFNGNTFAIRAHDHELCFGSAKKLQRQFKASLYASLREYVRTNNRSCIALCLERPEVVDGLGTVCRLRRVEVSPSFEMEFGRDVPKIVKLGSEFGKAVPFFRRATRATKFNVIDLNGSVRTLIGEGLDTTYNMLVFACPEDQFKAPVL
ncbi:MAG: ImmA/IrrE family metallo-endopeptidase [Pseudomonadota bacterium]